MFGPHPLEQGVVKLETFTSLYFSTFLHFTIFLHFNKHHYIPPHYPTLHSTTLHYTGWGEHFLRGCHVSLEANGRHCYIQLEPGVAWCILL